MRATSPPSTISASNLRRGTGTSSTWCGCSCSPASMSGAPAHTSPVRAGTDSKRIAFFVHAAAFSFAPAAHDRMSRIRTDFSVQALGQGLLVALVGYASSVAVVIQGLAAVGATVGQIASALVAHGVFMGLVAIV